jgi:hypothetical protein
MPPGRPITLRADDVATFTRAAICVGLAGLEKSRPAEVARRSFSDTRLELVLRAATAPTALSNAPALTQIAVALLDALVPASAGVDLLRRGVQLNFGGAAQISVPGIAIPAATFVGEGQAIPVRTAPTAAGPTLFPHKLSTIAALSGELLRSSNAETLVQQALVESAGPGIDLVLFSANPASAIQPAGLLNGIAPLTPAATGPSKSEVLVDDLQKLALAIGSVSGNGDVVLIGSPDAAAALKMRLPSAVEWPVLQTNSLAPRTVIAVATAAIVSAIDGVPRIEQSTDAAVHFDDQPGDIVDIGGVFARPVGSLFQTDEIGLKLKWPLSWGLRDARGVAFMTGVNW